MSNFLETLILLTKYDGKIHDHLKKVQSEHKKSHNKKGPKGHGPKITFMSNKSQEKLIHIIGGQITNGITQKKEVFDSRYNS